jgi:hypothetical protein
MVDQFVSLVDGYKLLVIGILIMADFLAGIIVAIKDKTFAWSKIANFLKTDWLFMAGGYLVVGMVATIEDSLQFLVPATFGVLSAGLLAGIVVKLKKLGVPVPGQTP